MRRSTPLYVAALLVGVAALRADAQPAERYTPEEMLRTVTFVRGAEPALAPSGDLAVYATVDVTDERNIRAQRPTGLLWSVPAAGGAPARIGADGTFGVQPVWSPDGTRLAFVHSNATGSHLAIWERATGDLRTLGPPLGTDRAVLPLGALGPRWMPDGRSLVIAVAEPAPGAAEVPRVRVLTSTDAIVPGDRFFTDTRTWRLVRVDVADGVVRHLIPDAIALRGFDLAPDGAHVLFRAVTPETLGLFRREETRTWLVPTDGSGAPRLAMGERRAPWVAFSPDGSALLFADGQAIHGVPVTGGEPVRVIDNLPGRARSPQAGARGHLALLVARPETMPPDTGMYTILRPVEDLVVVDLAARTVTALTARDRDDEIADVTWSADGSALIYRATDQATYRDTVWRWRPGAASPEELVGGHESVGGLSVSADGRVLAFAASSAVTPEEGYVRTADGTRRQITDLNPQLAGLRFTAPERFEYSSADGDPLAGLLFKPAEASAGHPVPVVTYVYEKLTPQQHRFNPEAQLHVAHGYGYLMPDVLVKPGYTGESFVKSVVPAVHAVRAMGFTNGRFGITGGSFGGYAGLFLISHVDIFSAAVVRAPPSEFFSTWGDGRDRDIYTIERGQARTGGTPWEVRERYIANSPFFHADRVRTPVLILHGEKDFTVPFQQGEMMFYALRALGRTAEFVIYREGDHSIVRGSKHDFLDYYDRTLAWWARYLRQPAAAPTDAASPSRGRR